MIRMMQYMFRVCLIVLVMLPCALVADEVQQFKTPKGISVWLIENHNLPIIAMSFVWRGGIEGDDDAKQGLSHIAAHMLTKGAGTDDENAFQKKLQDHAITLGFRAQRDGIYGQMRSLKETWPLAADLLRASLNAPRFDTASLNEVKAETLTQLKRYQADPDWMLSRLMMCEAFAGHPYSKRTLGTPETLSRIAQDDLKRWHKRLTRAELLVSVTGDISKDELNKQIDDMFGNLPETADQIAVPNAELKTAKEVFAIYYNGPQTSMILLWPGINRHDKDWYAAEVMNYILGGGSFSSRLMNEIREKRGLTYGISSGMSGFDHADTYTIQASFKNENAGQVMDFVKAQIARMRDTDVSADELKAAKDYLIGSYALGLTSTAQVAGHYLEIQREKLQVNEQQIREAGIMAVTSDDVRRVANRILNNDAMTAFFVGQPNGIIPTQQLQSIE